MVELSLVGENYTGVEAGFDGVVVFDTLDNEGFMDSVVSPEPITGAYIF